MCYHLSKVRGKFIENNIKSGEKTTAKDIYSVNYQTLDLEQVTADCVRIKEKNYQFILHLFILYLFNYTFFWFFLL